MLPGFLYNFHPGLNFICLLLLFIQPELFLRPGRLLTDGGGIFKACAKYRHADVLANRIVITVPPYDVSLLAGFILQKFNDFPDFPDGYFFCS